MRSMWAELVSLLVLSNLPFVAPLRSMQMLEVVPDPNISIRCSKLGHANMRFKASVSGLS